MVTFKFQIPIGLGLQKYNYNLRQQSKKPINSCKYKNLKMSTTGDSTKWLKTQKDVVSPNKYKNQTRSNKLKQIDAIYKSQIEQIYSNKSINHALSSKDQDKQERNIFSRKAIETKNKTTRIGGTRTDDFQNVSTSSRALHSLVSQQKLKSSKYVAGNSSKTVDLLKLQNQNKDIKVRELINKCQYLLQKLRGHISANEFSQEVEALTKLVENKIQRFENLFKIKNQEIFFKTRLQILSLLHEFDVPKEELDQINHIQTENSLFSFMAKKIKGQLKSFRYRQQQNCFELQKDKILSQKYEERITYLTETNQLLKMSQQKLKQKNENFKKQLHEFLEKLKEKQMQLQQSDSQVFRLKRENQQLLSSSNRTQQIQKKLKQDQQGITGKFQAKQREYKVLINRQSIQKKRVQSELQQKQSLIGEMLIKQKYLAQENERINRQLVRIKERYEWCQKQLDNKRKQHEQEKSCLLEDFKKYRLSNNESILLVAKAETDEAMHKIQEYQQAYSRVSMQLQEEKKASQLKYQQYLLKVESIQQTWIEKTKRIEQIREEELQQISRQYQEKHQQVRRQFQKKEKLIAQEMQAKMKALLAQKDKKMTQKLIQMENQNQQLRKQLQNHMQVNSTLQGRK